MVRKATYEEFEERVRDIERENIDLKESVRLIREREKKLNELIIAGPVVIYRCEPKGHFPTTFMTENIRNQLGYEPHEFTGEADFWANHIHPDDALHVFSNLSNLFKKGYHIHEYRFLHKDGTYRWMYDDLRLINDVNGKPKDIVGTWMDVTDRKRAEEERMKLQTQLANAAEIAHLGHWEYDVSNNIFTFNDNFYKIFHTAADEVGGYSMTADEYAKRFLHPDDLHLVGEETQKAIEATDPNYSRQMEHRIIYAEGTVGHIIVRIFIEKDADGKTIKIYGVNQDITDRKQAEKKLKDSENMLKVVLDSIPSAVFWKDRDLLYLGGNRTWLEASGMKSSEAVVGKSDYDLPWEKKQADSFREDDREVMESGFPKYGIVEPYQKSDGTQAWARTNKVPLKDAKGNVIGVLGTYEDITEKKRMEEEILRSQKLESLGLLAGGIAHDFNNILTTILGNINMAKDQTSHGSEVFELLSDAEAASRRAQRLTKQLLTFAKGGIPIKVTALIGDIIKESSLFVTRGSKSGCEFSFAEDLWPVEVDVGQMNQVISNVVMNANQAMPEGGLIHIKAENMIIEDEKNEWSLKPGRYIRICVEDEGVGIVKKHLSKIFDPYFTTKQEERGLGLATTYSIVKSHAGLITVESEVGVGTTFNIYLPASDKVVPQKEGTQAIKGEGRILVMDDEVSLRKMVGRVLEKLGYEAEFARDGAEAVKMVKNAKAVEKLYDAVILDLTVPGGMGGKETIDKLLEIDPQVRAIVSSGYSEHPVMANYREYGFKGMIEKPFHPQLLSKVLHEVLKGEKS